METANIYSVKDYAATAAQDAASHGYNGREGKAAQLLKECARAVRIAARKVESLYSVPAVSANERADYGSELAALLIGDNGGHVPARETIARGYLVKRAQGLILNDRGRRGLDLEEPASAEAGADPRLTGPLSVPEHVSAFAASLDVSETARRALIAEMVPATRREWADFYGYASPKAWHVTANRGRAELYSIGEDALRNALADAEEDAAGAMDDIEQELRSLIENAS